MAWEVDTARRHESTKVAPLLDASLFRGFRPETMAADKGYDIARVYAECKERACEPVIPMRGVKGKQPVLPIGLGGRLFPRIACHSERFRDVYSRRVAVEGGSQT